MFDGNRSASIALRLITNGGQDITHRRVIEGTYNPNTGAVVNTNEDTTVKAADFSINDGNKYFVENVQSNDRYALVSAGVASIDVSDLLIIGGVTWNIVNVKTCSLKGVNVFFSVHIRR